MADVTKALNIVRKLSPSGFFSRAAEEAQRLPQAKGTGEQMRAMLLRQGVKPDELKWTGFDEWAKGKKNITREDVAKFLDENRVRVDETVLGAPKGQREFFVFDEDRARRHGPFNSLDEARAAQRQNGWNGRIDAKPRTESNTKFDQYTLPGGKNYREMLLTRPPARNAADDYAATVKDLQNQIKRLEDSNPNWSSDLEQQRRALFSQLDEANAKYRAAGKPEPEATYQSSHFPDTPNPLVHMRMKERVDPEGRRVLHLEEVQSDWAQEGRRKGFAPQPLSAAERQEALELTGAALGNRATDAQLARLNELDARVSAFASDVPSAPFVESTPGWTNLALKRAMIEAARGNFDAIAWTPGAEQAKRFDLSKQVREIAYNPNTGYFKATGIDGGDISPGKAVRPEELSNYIGKEAAEKLMQREPTNVGVHVLQGDDLRVGGEGMKGYYDKILPTQISKVLKDIGETPQFGNVSITRGNVGASGDDIMKALPETRDMNEAQRSAWWQSLDPQRRDQLFADYRAGSMELPSFNITPEMREKIKQGLPLFTMLPAAVGLSTTASQVVEGQNPAEEPQGFAGGGKIVQRAIEAARKALAPEDLLMGVHNTGSTRKLDMIERLGGLPAPSIAVTKPSQGFSSFGDISLIAPVEMVTPSRKVPVFGSDVYSPRFPSVEDDKIFRGFTPAGNRRYAPVTMENVLREMKGNIRGGEGFHYGPSSIRAQVTPQFRSIAEMQEARGKIMPDASFKAEKEASNEMLEALREKFEPYFKPGSHDRSWAVFPELMTDFARTQNPSEFAYHYKNLPVENIAEARSFLGHLRDMPTEYFEAKPQRAVSLGEFSGAVVPANIPGSVVDRIRKMGINRIEEYGDEPSRADALMKFVGDQGFADGGHVGEALRLIQDKYPTHYLPNVGRQVMADGGSPEGAVNSALDVARRQGVDEVLLGRQYVRPEGEQTASAREDEAFITRLRKAMPTPVGVIRGIYNEGAEGVKSLGRGDYLEGGLQTLFSPFTGTSNALVRDPVLAMTGNMRKAQEAANTASLMGGYAALARSALKSAARGIGDGVIRTTGRTVGYPAYGALTVLPMMQEEMTSNGREARTGLYDAYGDLSSAVKAFEPSMVREARRSPYGFKLGGSVSHRAMMLAKEIGSSPRETTTP